jgi:hypothetical protein
MTPSQLQALKTAIDASPSWSAFPINDDGHFALAAVLNQTASPVWYATRTSLSRHEILTGTSDDGTTFSWAGGAYITRAQGERDAFREMFNSTGAVNPGLASITAAFNDIFSGAGGLPNRTHILAMSRRPATSGEKVLATGLGTKASPGILGFEGTVTPSDVQQARSLP